MKLLVDADYVVYKCCAGAETEIDWGDDVILVTSKFSEAYANVKRELLKIINNFLWDVPELILFFSDSVNFRKSIQPAYKGHRNRKKPCGYRRVINELKKEFEVIIMGTAQSRRSGQSVEKDVAICEAGAPDLFLQFFFCVVVLLVLNLVEVRPL